ncbi:hypothetical protein F5J12DRAFT_783093 [Pisolithus orientalis]|uniref:uncharacterized protein n=1 Tax=Pisolithus orientalis TaxID=936130 RepID=UPI0022255A04|nr:uncharacterized protein F5J12DRAFT_783093 [Pisolithus orientalis]KAI6006338.1 hypothetical protein F5J12DRAFT_783093 [Pisolithus orientalis]
MKLNCAVEILPMTCRWLNSGTWTRLVENFRARWWFWTDGVRVWTHRAWLATKVVLVWHGKACIGMNIVAKGPGTRGILPRKQICVGPAHAANVKFKITPRYVPTAFQLWQSPRYDPVLIFERWIAGPGPWFHPYARVKPSARERAMAARYTSDPDGLFSDEQRIISSYQTMVADSVRNHSLIIARGLDNAVNVTHSVDTHLRNLSVSTLVADLAVLMCRTPSPTGRHYSSLARYFLWFFSASDSNWSAPDLEGASTGRNDGKGNVAHTGAMARRGFLTVTLECPFTHPHARFVPLVQNSQRKPSITKTDP